MTIALLDEHREMVRIGSLVKMDPSLDFYFRQLDGDAQRGVGERIQWKKVSPVDIGMIVGELEADGIWLVLFDEVVVEVLKDFTDSKGDKGSWLVPAIL